MLLELKRKVLVTGAGGFVGREVFRQLKNSDYEVYATDIKKTKEISYLDVTDFQAVYQFLKKRHFGENDFIIHLAARVAGIPSLKDPWSYFYTNITGTLNILEAMKVLGIKNLVFASSWSTYGSNIPLPIDEDTPQHPENPYGASKKACEALIESYATHKKYWDLRVVVLRPTMIYGTEQEEKNVFQQVVECMLSGEKFEIYGTGTHTREFLHQRDAARVFIKALEVVPKIKDWEIFILGTENPIEIRNLAKLASKIKKFPIVFKNVPTWAFSQRSDMTKLKKVFGIDTKDFISLKEGLEECLRKKSKYKSSGQES